jgi:hypothetical protein
MAVFSPRPALRQRASSAAHSARILIKGKFIRVPADASTYRLAEI